MKKSLLAFAALATLAGAASAQSAVTLSGSVDLGVKRQGTGPDGDTDNNWSMGTAGSSRTAITFSGTEDLGGGLRAFFLANHRFNANDGTENGSMFWRQSWVGIGGAFGDVRLGRMLVPLQDFNGQYEVWEGGDTVGTVHTGGISSGFTNARTNSTVYYRSPSLAGFMLHASIADGDANGGGAAVDEDGDIASERPIGVGVKFDSGPFSAAIAGDQTATDVKTVGAYAKYNFGFATLYGQFEKGDVIADADGAGPGLPAVGEDDVQRWSLSAGIPLGAAVIKVGYTDWDDEEVSKWGLGADYNLSKRTRLYTNVGKVSGDGASDALKKTQFDLGIQHRF